MSESKKKVFAIIVSFNPNLATFKQIIEATTAQVECIIVVDNGSEQATLELLNEAISLYDNVKTIRLSTNIGIASAQNEGIRTALEYDDCTHILFLDHDSIPDQNMVSSLLKIERHLLGTGTKVGAIGPTCVDRRTNTASGFVKKNKIFISRVYPDKTLNYIETDFLISSGSLVRCDVLKHIGLMNDGYFIDHVDTEWCFRAINAGYKLFGAGEAKLNHSLGENVVRIWCGRWREIPQHKPFRYYYIFRNTLTMIRNTEMSFSWKMTHLYRLTLFLLFFSLVGSGRMQKMKMIYMGVKDNINKVDGKLRYNITK